MIEIWSRGQGEPEALILRITFITCWYVGGERSYGMEGGERRNPTWNCDRYATIYGGKEFTKERSTNWGVEFMAKAVFDILPEISFNLVIDIWNRFMINLLNFTTGSLIPL